MSDEQTFGPFTPATVVENAYKSTLETWWYTYARWVERRLAKPNNWIQQPGSIVLTSDWDHFAEESLPAVMIMACEVQQPRMDGNKEYRAHFPVEVCVYVSGPDRISTEQLAKYYGVLMRALILQKGSLGNVAVGTVWDGERYGVHVSDKSQRTIGSAEIKFTTEVIQVVRRFTGPAEPLLTPVEPANFPTVVPTPTFPKIEASPVNPQSLPSVWPEDELYPLDQLTPGEP